MAQYTVKAPDGKTITIQGPDGASQADVIAQAQALYKPSAAPAPKPKPAAQSNEFLTRYNQIRDGLAAKFTDPNQKATALARFDADPRAQSLRKAAGLAPLSTRQNDVRQVARKSVSQRLTDAGTDLGQRASRMQSASAGIARGMFGIPEILAAAGVRFLPSSITGNNTDASFSNILQLIRSKNNAAIQAHPGYGYTGEIAGNIVGGGAAGRLVMRGSGRLAAAGVPVASRAARAVEAVGTLRKGQKVRNAAKIATIGAAGGGAQAAGEGSDVVEGAATGAVAAPVLAGGFKVAQVITRPARDLLSMLPSKADRILSRLTTATRDALETRAAQYRADTGAEPTLFELLPLADRNKILKQAVVGKDNVVEAASNAIRARARNLGPEMSSRAREILQPGRDFVERGINRDVTAARGGTAAPDDPAMVAEAIESPTDMLHLRDEEARAIMAPHENTPVVDSLEDLFPHVPGPGGTRVATDPEVAAVIRSAARPMAARAQGAGVTAGDITDMISTLRGDIGKGGIEGRNADRAVAHLQDMLDMNAPEAGAAARQMSDAYAARSRMAEGMKEGEATRLRDEVQVGTSRKEARRVRNAYDTPEGAAGRTLGQGNRVIRDLGGSPEEALRATVKMSRNNVGRQLRENIGATEAEQLTRAARAQDESAQALAAASNKAQSGSGEVADAEGLVQAIAGLHPSSFITTKAGAVRRLLDMTYIPENRARTIVDMIFSQNPDMMRRALRAVGNEPNGAKFVKTLAGIVGQQAAGGAPDVLPEDTDLSTHDETPSAEKDIASVEQPEEQQPADTPEAADDSPYAQELANVYAEESPELLDLIDRVEHQESRGNQGAVSSAGAVGVMQVMPETAPEAAALAGLPWDEEAYRNDATYNKLLGIAYLSELLRKYDGDVARALAAYNAGPGRTDEALAAGGANFLAHLPAETQDYVARVG